MLAGPARLPWVPASCKRAPPAPRCRNAESPADGRGRPRSDGKMTAVRHHELIPCQLIPVCGHSFACDSFHSNLPRSPVSGEHSDIRCAGFEIPAPLAPGFDAARHGHGPNPGSVRSGSVNPGSIRDLNSLSPTPSAKRATGCAAAGQIIATPPYRMKFRSPGSSRRATPFASKSLFFRSPGGEAHDTRLQALAAGAIGVRTETKNNPSALRTLTPVRCRAVTGL